MLSVQNQKKKNNKKNRERNLILFNKQTLSKEYKKQKTKLYQII